MKLSEEEMIDFESIIIRKQELIRLLTDTSANDYDSTNENVIKGWFISLSNTLIAYSIKEYELRKEISKKYGIPYGFSYFHGEVFIEDKDSCDCCN